MLFLSYGFKCESTCMWNIWAMANCSCVCLKDACKVSWHDSNSKWSVGGLRQSADLANKLLAIWYQITMCDCETTFTHFQSREKNSSSALFNRAKKCTRSSALFNCTKKTAQALFSSARKKALKRSFQLRKKRHSCALFKRAKKRHSSALFKRVKKRHSSALFKRVKKGTGCLP